MITILIYNDFTLAISHPLKRQPQLHTYASIPTWASEKTMRHTRGEIMSIVISYSYLYRPIVAAALKNVLMKQYYDCPG